MYAQPARTGQFLGFSHEHSSTAGLIHPSVVTGNPLPSSKWASRWMHTRVELESADSGPFFCLRSQTALRPLLEWLGLGSQTLPRQGKDQIIQSRLSSRRGATTEATNDNMTGATLDRVNGWRKRDVFKGTEPGLAMRQVYTDALSAIKTTIQYSQSLWGPRGYGFEAFDFRNLC